MSRRKYLNDFRVPQNPDRPSKNLKKLPKIWDVPMHWVQERASDSGHIYARGAETRPRFRAYYSDLGMACPRFWAQYSDLGMACPGFWAYYSDLGMACPGFRAQYSDLGMACPGFWAYYSDLGMACHGFRA